MTLQRFIGLVCLALVVMVAVLWQRIRVLEYAVERLIEARAPAISGERKASKATEFASGVNKHLKKANDAPVETAYFEMTRERKGPLLFPVDVERAMLGEGNSRGTDWTPTWELELSTPKEFFTPGAPFEFKAPTGDIPNK